MYSSKKRPGHCQEDGPPSSRFCEQHYTAKGKTQLNCRVCSKTNDRVFTAANPAYLVLISVFFLWEEYHTKKEVTNCQEYRK